MQILVPAGSGGSAQHPLMSTHAFPDTQSALVWQVVGSATQNPSATAQKTLPSVLFTHSQVVALGLLQRTFPAQRSVFAGQMPRGKHVPAWQTWFPAQPLPQPPQWASAVWVLAQMPLQQVSGPAQAMPHPPQWALLDCVSRQTSPQSVNPTGHTHCPSWQNLPPLHTPHEPPWPLSPQILSRQFGTHGTPALFVFLRFFRPFFLAPTAVGSDRNGSGAQSAPARPATMARRALWEVSARTTSSKRSTSTGTLRRLSHGRGAQDSMGATGSSVRGWIASSERRASKFGTRMSWILPPELPPVARRRKEAAVAPRVVPGAGAGVGSYLARPVDA